MELDDIKELIAKVEGSKIKKLCIKNGDFELQIEKDTESVVSSHDHHVQKPLLPESGLDTMLHHPDFARMGSSRGKTVETAMDGKFITSPMVGTFYAAPSPDQPLFVKVGDRVDENTVVCVIEAMKVMNEVKANVSGVVAEILIENAHPVEFGSKIFRIV